MTNPDFYIPKNRAVPTYYDNGENMPIGNVKREKFDKKYVNPKEASPNYKIDELTKEGVEYLEKLDELTTQSFSDIKTREIDWERINEAYELSEEEYKAVLVEEFAKSAYTWFNDLMLKQNYIASTVMSQGFDVDNLNDAAASYSEIRESKEEGWKLLESSLTEDEQKLARIYALELYSAQLEKNIAKMPDYGDVRQYYNEGSFADWIFTHPVTFGFEYLLDEYVKNTNGGEIQDETTTNDTNAEKVLDFWNNTLAKDGLFTPINAMTGSYAENADKHFIPQLLGNIKSIDNIEKNIQNKYELIEELGKNIDNPEMFAQLYYELTDGANFNADKIYEYKILNETEISNGTPEDKLTAPSDSIIGRNHIAEDIQKNEMMTNILYELNKTFGTMACKAIPIVGPLVAGVVNSGVTILEEKTQENSEMTKGELVNIILKEGIARYFLVNELGNIVSKTGLSKVGTNAATAATQEKVETTNSAIGNFIDGNIGAGIGNIVENILLPKAQIKAFFKSLFKH